MRDDYILDDLGPDDELEELSTSRPVRSGSISDDLDSVELGDLGLDITASASVVRGVLLDPENIQSTEEEPEMLYDEVDDAEIEEAESIDLAQFSRKDERGFDTDAFEEWVSISRKHGNLKPEEIDRLLRLAQGDDEELRGMAADKLIRHNVKWIVRCLRKSRLVGPGIMNYPSDLRDDMLSLGRMGFFIAIQKYDFEKAVKKGVKGHRKSFLHYSAYWIDKLVGEFLNVERLGLNDDAAQDLKRVTDTREELTRLLGHTPTNEQIAERLEQKARAKLAAEGETDPSMKRLRRRGALTVDRVAELSRHPTRKVSVDAPVSTEEDGPSLGEYIADEDRGADEQAEVHAVFAALKARLDQIPDARRRWVFKMLHAMATDDGVDYHMAHNPPEAALFAARSRDSIVDYEEETREAMLGEATVRVDSLTLPGYTFTLNKVTRLRALAAMGDEAVSPQMLRQLEQLRDDICQALPLAEFLRADGVQIDSQDPEAPVHCPFEEGVLNKPTFRIKGETYACKSCGAKGDLITWFESRRGMTREEALATAARIAISRLRDEIRRAVSLPDILRADGVHIDPRNPETPAPCPFEGPTSRARTLIVRGDAYSCSACGAEGDVFRWLETRRGLDASDALVEAAWLALALPPTVRRDDPNVVVVTDPVRRAYMKRLN